MSEERPLSSQIKGLREYKQYIITLLKEENIDKISLHKYKRLKRSIDKQIKHLLSLKDKE